MPQTTERKPRRKRCTYCGNLGYDMEPHRDAAWLLHWFHADCWQEFALMLSGPPRPPRGTPDSSKEFKRG